MFNQYNASKIDTDEKKRRVDRNIARYLELINSEKVLQMRQLNLNHTYRHLETLIDNLPNKGLEKDPNSEWMVHTKKFRELSTERNQLVQAFAANAKKIDELQIEMRVLASHLQVDGFSIADGLSKNSSLLRKK